VNLNQSKGELPKHRLEKSLQSRILRILQVGTASVFNDQLEPFARAVSCHLPAPLHAGVRLRALRFRPDRLVVPFVFFVWEESSEQTEQSAPPPKGVAVAV
jgi:hypothetical protein